VLGGLPPRACLGADRRRRRADDPELVELLSRAVAGLEAGLADLRELAHGIHPAILTDRGLPAALESLAARSSVPVTVDAALDDRLDRAVETALSFTAAEALTNVAKYAGAVVPVDQTACAGSGRPGVAASSALRA
jgi:signal transduction histidine kinase